MLDGKWSGIMSHRPRNLVVFAKPIKEFTDTPLVEDKYYTHVIDGADYNNHSGEKPINYGMGYQRGAIHLKKKNSVTYTFDSRELDSLHITTMLAPNHPTDGTTLRYSISVDGGDEQIVDIATQGRSEEWKLNVLRNQAIRETTHLSTKKRKSTLKITALDEGIVIDQIKIN